MQDVTSRVLKTVLRADARFEQIQQGRWMLAPVSHLERLGHLRRAPLPLVQGPPAWDRHAPPEFDPMSPDHPAAEYVAFLMAQPDVSLPVLTSTLMTLLRTRTAAPVALINRAVLTDALQADPRFTALSGRRWDLASPHRLRLSSKTSLIQHVRAVMALPDVRLPLSTWALAELLTTRTTLDPARCKFTSLQSALTRDPYFYRVEVGLWTRSDTPLTPEDKARLEAHLPSRGRADPLQDARLNTINGSGTPGQAPVLRRGSVPAVQEGVQEGAQRLPRVLPIRFASYASASSSTAAASRSTRTCAGYSTACRVDGSAAGSRSTASRGGRSYVSVSSSALGSKSSSSTAITDCP